MSKRTRASRATRPGTRPPINRAPGARALRPKAAEAAATPRLAEEAVAELASAAPPTPRRVGPVAHARLRAKPGSVLAARAANEYVYVGQDIRRITLVAGSLFAAMILAWLLIAVLRVIELEFY